MLFGLLFFIPVFGMAVGAGLGALFGHLEKSMIDKEFRQQVRDMVQPGTSALFLVVEKATPDKAVAAMSKFGGTVLKTWERAARGSRPAQGQRSPGRVASGLNSDSSPSSAAFSSAWVREDTPSLR